MLKYTGHPLVDVGVATITAFADRDDPSEVTAEDLQKVVAYIEGQYSKNPMRSFLTVIFPNSGFTQPAFDTQPEKRAAYARTVLEAWKPETPQLSVPCVFFGTPAVARAVREMMPLVGAESGFNFYPEGTAGIPVSGEALLAIQAFPLGCLKCNGRVLLIHADDPKLTKHFAREALSTNRRYLDVSAQGASKYADTKFPRTQIIDQLMKAEVSRRDAKRPTSITAYHLTNYGTNASVDILYLPMQITDFLWAATDDMYRDAWNRLVRRGWEGAADTPERDDLGWSARRNVLYEDLFALPRDARRFLRTYLLRTPQVQATGKDDQRRTYNLANELDLVSWPLTRLFMRKVMNMDQERIETIRNVADKIADHIQRTDNTRLFREFLTGRNNGQGYQRLRDRLIRENYEAAKVDGPLITVDEYIETFENSDDRFWWMLARDLILIRMIERLHANKWIGKHPDITATPRDEDPEQETE